MRYVMSPIFVLIAIACIVTAVILQDDPTALVSREYVINPSNIVAVAGLLLTGMTSLLCAAWVVRRP